MTVHCTHCKNEVIHNEDGEKKNGHLRNSHKSCQKEMNALNTQYAYLLLGNICRCCGSKENIEAGHINFPKTKVVRAKHTKFGFTHATGDSITSARFPDLIRTHAVIPVCRSCNKSMGNKSTCRIHRKYLGIWNYLPHLDDLEA